MTIKDLKTACAKYQELEPGYIHRVCGSVLQKTGRPTGVSSAFIAEIWYQCRVCKKFWDKIGAEIYSTKMYDEFDYGLEKVG